MSDRPSVDQYFMEMTHLVKARGTCPRRLVGAVIVKDKRVLTTGYNGAPRNFPHPCDVGCLRDELQIPHGMLADICPCLHAEQNAILQAATTGVSIEGADLYCTTQPCTQCSRMLANCGIQRVVFEEEYPDPLAIGILVTGKVQMLQWDPKTKTAAPYKHQNTFEQAQDELRRRWKAGQGQPQLPVLPRSPLGAGTAAPARAATPAPSVPRASPALDQPRTSAGLEEAVPLRDLRNDPNREELIRKLAHEKADRRRKAAEQAGRET